MIATADIGFKLLVAIVFVGLFVTIIVTNWINAKYKSDAVAKTVSDKAVPQQELPQPEPISPNPAKYQT